MFRLFSNVWLVHESEADRRFIHSDWVLQSTLSSQDAGPAWQKLLDQPAAEIICSDENFVRIILVFWNHTLSHFNSKSVRDELWNLYLLDLVLKNKLEIFNSLKLVDIDAVYSSVCTLNFSELFKTLKLGQLGYEYLLPNYLINGRGKKELLNYVRWCCWSLLASELQLFLKEIRTDIFSGHHVLGHNKSLDKEPVSNLPEIIAKSSSWKLVANHNITRVFNYSDADKGIELLMQHFPTPESMLVIFNNHAQAHRDEQGVNSFADPINLIYAEKYEELLIRDLEMDFRITYASEHLADEVVGTMVSRIYRAFRNNKHQDSYYKKFEVKLLD